MNKELIELQQGNNATCVIIKEDHIKELDKKIIMDANITDEYLFSNKLGNPIFKEKLEKFSNSNDITYFVIRNIDNLDESNQNKYIGLVKDREFHGYNLPSNVIIVFTINDKESIRKISKELYHFCVVAF